MSFFFLFLSIITLTLGHLLKMIRWSKFIEIYEDPRKGNLLRALSIGHIINYVLPFHAGDIFRIIIAGRKMRNGIGFSFATVIVEHYIDIIVVSAIFVGMQVGCGFSASTSTIVLYGVFLAIVIPITYLLIRFNKYIKAAIRQFTSIFNERIELSLLFFSWSLISSFKNMYRKISLLVIGFWSVLMWVSYLLSYWLIAESVKLVGCEYRLRDVFNMMFSSSSMKSLVYSNSLGIIDYKVSIIIGIYLLLPLLILYIISVIGNKKHGDQNYVNLLPYVNPADRLNFLETFFSGNNNEQHKGFLDINKDINILQDYSAGSNATTMLCMNKNVTFYRKYSFGQDSEKLWQQIEWINKNADKLPLPQILNVIHKPNICCYDMEYSSYAIGFFQYIHSNPVEQSWSILRNVLETLNSSLYINQRSSDRITAQKYISEKVVKNLHIIKESILLKDIQKYETIVVNGTEFENLPILEGLLSEDNLLDIFASDSYSDIHGDLTIENIICNTLKQSEKGDFYIIDPNVGNIHNSMYLDYGKLLQSLHGGYEFMMKTKAVKVEDNHIDFTYTRSSAYDYLYEALDEYILEHFGIAGRKSIYYHELIHWLRLLPYKLRKDKERAAMFYAGLLFVLNKIKDL